MSRPLPSMLATILAAGLMALPLPTASAVAQTATSAVEPATPTAEQRLDQLLAAMGGRESWARVKGMRVSAVHWSARFAEPHDNDIWNDFASPRVRIEAKGGGLDRARAIADGQGWRRDEGAAVQAMTADAVKADTDFWETNVYRTLHRLAVGEPGLSVRLAENGAILEVLRADGTRLNWYRLNAAGEPIQFGTGDFAAGTVFGPLATGPEGHRHPRWGARPDGTWRYEIKAITVFDGPPPVMFGPPTG